MNKSKIIIISIFVFVLSFSLYLNKEELLQKQEMIAKAILPGESVKCDDANCDTCNAKGICTACKSGYTLNASGTCAKVCYKISTGKTYCSSETVSSSTCDSSKGYYSSKSSCMSNMSCLATQYKDTSTMKCAACGSGKEVKSNCTGTSSDCCKEKTYTCYALSKTGKSCIEKTVTKPCTDSGYYTKRSICEQFIKVTCYKLSSDKMTCSSVEVTGKGNCGDYYSSLSDCKAKIVKPTATPKPTAEPEPSSKPTAVPNKECKIADAVTVKKASPGESFTVTIKTTNCNNVTLSVTGTSNCSVTSSKSVTVKKSQWNDKGVKEVTFKMKAGDKKCSKAQFTINGKQYTIDIVDDWYSIGRVNNSKDLYKEDKNSANLAGEDYYGKCAVSVDKATYDCWNVYSRSCSSPQTETKACYGDASTLAKAKHVKWIYPSQRDTTYSTKISSVTKEADCKLPKETNGSEPNFCEPKSSVVLSQEKSTTTCEDNMSTETKSMVSCDGASFYKITCTNNATAKFDNGDDGNITTTTNSIYAGQGFEYGIKVSLTRECTAEFYSKNWLEAYNYVTKQINNAKTSKDKKTYETKRKRLIEIVNEYNTFDLLGSSSTSGTVSLKYTVNGKSKTISTPFEVASTQNGKGTYTDKTLVSLNVSGVTNPYSYKWSNKSNPTVIKLVPKKTYIDKTTGEVADSGIDSGNKIYVDYDTDENTYTMNISLSIYDGNLTINNNKCNVKVSKSELIYRPIDVSNPFINSSWNKGENWVNSQYDFTKTIHATTWNEATYNKIKITASDVVAIQDSNKNNRSDSPYLGLCDRIKSSLQDEITKKLCSLIK